MNNQQKALIYDEYLRQSDILQRENSKIKSEFAGNIPPQLQEKIRVNEGKIADLVVKLEDLIR